MFIWYKLILQLQQRFKIEAHNVYIEEINKIALSSNDDERLQTFDGITTYPYGTNAFKVCTSEMLSKYEWLILMIIQMKIVQKFKMKTEHNSRCPYIPDYPYRIPIIRGSGSGKTNSFLYLINNQPDIDKIQVHMKHNICV